MPQDVHTGSDRTRSVAIERILEVAGAEAERVGPDRMRMGEIARRAEVSRASLYRYFASKDDLIRAWTTREFDRIFADADAAAAAADSFEERLAAGFASALVALRSHPVFRSVVAVNNGQMTRSTLESPDALGHAREMLQERFNGAVRAGRIEVGQFDAAIAGELIARLAISLTITPETIGRLDSEEDVRGFAERYVAPLVRQLQAAAR
ncbi:MAG: helix-turn-helix domain-containing protein [Solirubrobacterales bacterium]